MADAAPGLTLEADDSIIRRIAALLARAADEASTPAEAAMAIDRAARLMREYNLTRDEVELRKEGTRKFGFSASGAGSRSVNKMAVAISRLAQCRVTQSRTGDKEQFHFAGLRADVDYAEWLMRLCIATMQRGWRAWQTSALHARMVAEGADAAEIRDAYRSGFQVEICARIKALTAEAIPDPANALVVLRQQIITDVFGAAKGEMTNHVETYRRSTAEAYAFGKAEGGRVGIRQEVAGDYDDVPQITTK